jgi:hypothetical protein
MNGNALTYQSLTGPQRRQIYWGLLWRSLVAGVITGAFGFVCGFAINVAAAIYAKLAHTEFASYKPFLALLGGAIGLLIGCAVFWHYVKWIFRARLGAFRLRLILTSEDYAA